MRDLTAGLARPVLRLLGRDERGVAGVLVAVLIGCGVLLGIGALVVDVGQIYQNRAELQSGADAGALAVAKSCALGSCDSLAASAEASANASALTGHQAGVDLVCGSGTLGGCPADTGMTGAITDCPPNPPSGTNYVDVHTTTKTTSGTLLPPVFARTLLGNQNYDGTAVFACAQVEWGPSVQGDSLALTISYCDWESLTGGSQFNTLLPVYLKGKDKPCGGPAGSNLPGGFDWLATSASSTCTAVIDLTTSTTYNNTGNNVSGPCKQALMNYIDSYNAGKPVTVFLPIFDAVSGQGKNGTYHMIGLAGFVITGYANLPGAGDVGPTDYGTVNTLCLGSNPCIEGYFTPGIDPVSSIGSGTNFGAITLKLTG